MLWLQVCLEKLHENINCTYRLWQKYDKSDHWYFFQTNREGSGTMNLGGSLTRQVEQDSPVSEASPHIANIGRMVEDMENKIR